MKKIIFLGVLFLIYTTIVCFCPFVTQWDRNVIVLVQDYLHNIPIEIPTLLDTHLYAALIVIPLIFGFLFFLKELLIIDMVLFLSAPLVAYIFNSIVKIIIHRPRPPFELQMAVHPHSYSFVSNHTLVTSCLWGLVIFYLIKYCHNKILKIICITLSVLWIIFVGISRVWLGVHNLTDVIGGYFLAGILLYAYISIIKLIGGKS